MPSRRYTCHAGVLGHGYRKHSLSQCHHYLAISRYRQRVNSYYRRRITSFIAHFIALEWATFKESVRSFSISAEYIRRWRHAAHATAAYSSPSSTHLNSDRLSSLLMPFHRASNTPTITSRAPTAYRHRRQISVTITMLNFSFYTQSAISASIS